MRTTTVASKLDKMLSQDYNDNFRPGKEITALLTAEDMKLLIEDKYLLEKMRFTWPYAFYVKQVWILSGNKFMENASMPGMAKIGFLDELKNLTKFCESNEASALVALFQLMHFKQSLSKPALMDIFLGITITDDHCAQISYQEFKSR